MSSTTENATLKMHLKGTDPTYRGNATQYLALFNNNALTAADLAAGGHVYELTYTGYLRLAITKGTAWTENGASFSNAAIIQFGTRSDGGATQTAKYFAIVDTASGDYAQGIYGQLSSEIPISQNVQPQFGIGDLTITAI
jgi:hypothetical protein